MLDIGKCKAHRTFMFCPDCKGVYPPEKFEKSVPPYSNVGYDVMVLTGQQAGAMLKMRIRQKGGYILHIDEVSNFVLANVKIPSESKEQLVPFLQQIRKQYGEPLAVNSDMVKNNRQQFYV